MAVGFRSNLIAAACFPLTVAWIIGTRVAPAAFVLWVYPPRPGGNPAAYAIGTIMVGYGYSKVFNLQFPSPTTAKLEQPFGDASPMGLL